MDARCTLSDDFDETFEPKHGEIHVLVQLPPLTEAPVTTRQRVEIAGETSLVELWNIVEWKHELPRSRELNQLLKRPLPFRLTLQKPDTATLTGPVNSHEIFQPDAPLIDCPKLAMMMDSYLELCETMAPCYNTPSSTWQHFYDALLRIPVSLCRASGIRLEQTRCGVDTEGTITPIKRPDCFLSSQSIVFLRGEERDASVSTTVSFEQLMTTMKRWNVLLYGDLPYLVSYATSGSELTFVAIKRTDSPLVNWKWVLTLDILREKEATLKAFVNLAMLLRSMVMKTQRQCGLFLEPFKPDTSENRTLVLTDNVIVRVITRAQCRDAEHFERLGDVYTTLKTLNSPTRVQVPYLQIVERLTMESWRLVVHLSPVGYVRRPKVHEVKQWLQHLLTGLKHWHERGYCHGDVQWRNIVFVPRSASGAYYHEHWILIDMDESRHHDVKIITWNHQRNGERLRFQHDLFQLGKLMETLQFELPKTLTKMKQLLLHAVDNTEITAADALAILQ